MGILALIVSIVFGFIPMPGVVSLIGCCFSLLFSFIGLVADKRKSCSVVALIFSLLGILGSAILISYFGMWKIPYLS